MVVVPPTFNKISLKFEPYATNLIGKSTNFVVYTHFPDELKRKDFVEFSRNYTHRE